MMMMMMIMMMLMMMMMMMIIMMIMILAGLSSLARKNVMGGARRSQEPQEPAGTLGPRAKEQRELLGKSK